MSGRRLAGTAVAMAVIAVGLAGLAPGPGAIAAAFTAPQRVADTAGADALVLALAGAIAWLVWAWGTLGLALTAASALPGVLGAIARLALRVVLPAGARRGAALLLGLGLGLSTPIAAASAAPVPAATASPAPVPDWPAATPSMRSTAAPGNGVPDWPVAEPAGRHVVLRGDCLWDIAAARLQAQHGAAPTDAEVVTAVGAWWRANAAVIGPDPDLLLPGQVLVAPEPP